MEYEFILTLVLAPEDATDSDVLVERLGEAGCTGALVGVGRPGAVALKFMHEAQVAKDSVESVESALAAVKRAIPMAMLVGVEVSDASLADLGARITKHNLHKPVDFGGPVKIREVFHGTYFTWYRTDDDFGQLSFDVCDGVLFCSSEDPTRESVREALHALADYVADTAALEQP